MPETPPLIDADGALFLDVDGTLHDHVPDPASVRIPPARQATLVSLAAALGGALAVISSRAIDDLDRVLAPLRLPAAGQHGAESRLRGDVHVLAQASPALAQILARAQAFALRRPAIRIENKGATATVHYRGAESERAALGTLLAEAVAHYGIEFQLLAAHLAYDVRPREADKGRALHWFMSAPPFAGRVPVFIGDDRSDEDGFAAALARGGRAIRIGLGGETTATERIGSPDELWRWLKLSAAALSNRQDRQERVGATG